MNKSDMVKLIYTSKINELTYKYTQEELIKKSKKELENILGALRKQEYLYLMK